MRVSIRLCIGIVVLLCTIAPASSGSRERRLTILYFNDIHGHLEPWKPNGEGEATVGGIARIGGLVARIRSENARSGRATIVLEAGDILQGTPMSAIFRGQPDVVAFNALRLDAMAVGNHEFDFGQENLLSLVALARFPILSANVFHTDGRPFARASVTIEPLPGFRIAILGLTTRDAPATTYPSNVAGLVFDDPVATARHVVPLLRERSDLVVALTHIGLSEDQRLAESVPGVDVVIGGHTHLALGEPDMAHGAIICQAGDNGRFLGRLDLTVRDGRATVTAAALIPIDEHIASDRAIERLVGEYSSRIHDQLSAVVGRSRSLLDGERMNVRTRETTLGNFVTDRIREAAHSDIALVNGGSLRGSIGAGTVTYGDVLNALPFPNSIVVLNLRGSVLRAALDTSAALVPTELPGGFLQVSGLRFAIRDARATEIVVGSEPLDDERVYSVAAPDFLLAGGDGYSMLRDVDHRDTGLILNALILDYLRGGNEAYAAVEGRITRR